MLEWGKGTFLLLRMTQQKIVYELFRRPKAVYEGGGLRLGLKTLGARVFYSAYSMSRLSFEKGGGVLSGGGGGGG